MPGVRIEPWGPGDLPILVKTLADPAMTEHLGGPESMEKLVERQEKYEKLADSGTGRMFKIVDDETGEPVGSVGFWEKTWRDEAVYETGWFVYPEHQRRGIAKQAMRLLVAAARSVRKHRFMHAFPSVDNVPSNAIARSLGFTLLGNHEFEYPPGNILRCNDWRLDLGDG